MVDILTDLSIANASSFAAEGPQSHDKKSDYLFIYKKHKTNDSLFRKSSEYYSGYPEVYENIYERLVDNLSEMQANNAKISTDTLSGKP
ncbi:MAG: DUF4296 domain-containing protein [Bacteroidia bacterium]|nr:DUF4296 domain-containing protein [Bacteroidia bacterium]